MPYVDSPESGRSSGRQLPSPRLEDINPYQSPAQPAGDTAVHPQSYGSAMVCGILSLVLLLMYPVGCCYLPGIVVVSLAGLLLGGLGWHGGNQALEAARTHAALAEASSSASVAQVCGVLGVVFHSIVLVLFLLFLLVFLGFSLASSTMGLG